MKYTRSGGQSTVGPEAWFTGTVHIDGVHNPDEQSAVGQGQVATWGEHVTDQEYGRPTASTN